MSSIKAMLDDLREAGRCDYCRHNTDESNYDDCSGNCMDCKHEQCYCNGCEDCSKWIYYQEDHDEQ